MVGAATRFIKLVAAICGAGAACWATNPAAANITTTRASFLMFPPESPPRRADDTNAKAGESGNTPDGTLAKEEKPVKRIVLTFKVRGAGRVFRPGKGLLRCWKPACKMRGGRREISGLARAGAP